MSRFTANGDILVSSSGNVLWVWNFDKGASKLHDFKDNFFQKLLTWCKSGIGYVKCTEKNKFQTLKVSIQFLRNHTI